MSDVAKIERAKLPSGIQDDLDRRFIERAGDPRGIDGDDGLAGDSSRFNVEFLDEFGEGELSIDLIDTLS